MPTFTANIPASSYSRTRQSNEPALRSQADTLVNSVRSVSTQLSAIDLSYYIRQSGQTASQLTQEFLGYRDEALEIGRLAPDIGAPPVNFTVDLIEDISRSITEGVTALPATITALNSSVSDYGNYGTNINTAADSNFTLFRNALSTPTAIARLRVALNTDLNALLLRVHNAHLSFVMRIMTLLAQITGGDVDVPGPPEGGYGDRLITLQQQIDNDVPIDTFLWSGFSQISWPSNFNLGGGINSITIQTTAGSTTYTVGTSGATSQQLSNRPSFSGTFTEPSSSSSASVDLSRSGTDYSGSGGDVTSFLNSLSTSDGAQPLSVSLSFNEAPQWNVDTTDTIILQVGQSQTFTVPPVDRGESVTYSATGLPTGVIFNATTRVISFAPTAVASGNITITATNSIGSDTFTVPYSFTAAETPPVFPSTGGTTIIDQGDTETIQVPEASGNPTPAYVVVGTLPSGITFNTSTRVLTVVGNAQNLGTHTITIRAVNPAGTADWTHTVVINSGDAPLFPSPRAFVYIATINEVFPSYTIPAASGDNVIYSPAEGDLEELTATGLTYDAATRTIQGTPTVVRNATFVLWAENEHGSDFFQVYIIVIPVQVAPRWEPDVGPELTGQVSTEITPYQLPQPDANDVEGEFLAYNIEFTSSGLPAGLTFDTDTGIISGTPTTVGTGTITITATNLKGSDTFTVPYNISNEPSPAAAPVFTNNTGSITGTVGTTVTFEVPAAQGFPVPTYTSSDLPNGLSFNTETRTISGTPTEAGTGTITITATNSEGTDTFTLTYTFTESTTPQPPVTTPASPSWNNPVGETLRGSVGTPLTYSVPEADNNNAGVTYTATALPPGLIFNGSTRIISGNPTRPQTGTITITATIGDLEGTFVIPYVIAGAAEEFAPSFPVSSGAPITGRASEIIDDIQVPDAGGNPPPSYSASLPRGLSFDSNRRIISGTPTFPGTGQIIVTATNSRGSSTWTVDYTFGNAPETLPETPTGHIVFPGNSIIHSLVDVQDNVAFFVWQYRLVGNTEWEDFGFTRSRRILIQGLINDREYEVRVKARNGLGDSGWTTPISTTPSVVSGFAADGNRVSNAAYLRPLRTNLGENDYARYDPALDVLQERGYRRFYDLVYALPANEIFEVRARLKALARTGPHVWSLAEGLEDVVGFLNKSQIIYKKEESELRLVIEALES